MGGRHLTWEAQLQQRESWRVFCCLLWDTITQDSWDEPQAGPTLPVPEVLSLWASSELYHPVLEPYSFCSFSLWRHLALFKNTLKKRKTLYLPPFLEFSGSSEETSHCRHYAHMSRTLSHGPTGLQACGCSFSVSALGNTLHTLLQAASGVRGGSASETIKSLSCSCWERDFFFYFFYSEFFLFFWLCFLLFSQNLIQVTFFPGYFFQRSVLNLCKE